LNIPFIPFGLKNDLPRTYYTFNSDDGEDTFVHKSLDAMMSTVFSTFHKIWANFSADGSEVRRHMLEIHTVSLQGGIYHLHEQFHVYVPRAQDDAGPIRGCLQALYSVKSWLQGLRLPPTYELAQSRPRPSGLDDIKKTRNTPSS
ncbi:hypothetical protein BGZ83_011419, partial [Gryganskiella cystojenkinii]